MGVDLKKKGNKTPKMKGGHEKDLVLEPELAG